VGRLGPRCEVVVVVAVVVGLEVEGLQVLGSGLLPPVHVQVLSCARDC
jgi:hypothetical protein